MAHGLRSITNAGYMPYGSGRDWFFIGDFSYKNGCRTPDPNTRWRENQKGLTKPSMKGRSRGEPQEMKATKAINGAFGESASSSKKSAASRSMSPRIAERLRRQQSEPTCNDALQAGSLGMNHSNRWKDLNSSARVPKPVSCLRALGPRDTSMPPPGPAQSTYMDIGQVNRMGLNYTFSEFGAPEKFRYHSSLRSRDRPPAQDQIDDHMKEFPGSQKFPVAIQKKLYQNALKEVEHPIEKPLSKTVDGPGATLLEWGHPMKHHNSSNKRCFPPKDVEREQGESKAKWKPGEWGQMDKHRYHQPPLWAPKDDLGISRIPHGLNDPKACEIPEVGGFPKNVTRRQAKPQDHGIW